MEKEEALRRADLRENETLDDLQNGFFLLQSKAGFRFGIDAVLLADFASGVHDGSRILDMGCGNGIIPVLLAAKNPSLSIEGLEIQHDSAETAKRNVRLNTLQKNVSITEGDIKEAVSIFGAASFHAVVCNPPYMIGEHGLKNPSETLAIARHEVLCDFHDVARAASGLLPHRGSFYLVHRPFRLAELFRVLMGYRLEPKRMRLVHPYADKEPNLVLIEARKGCNPGMRVEKPLIVYEKSGCYTTEILDIYGKAHA